MRAGPFSAASDAASHSALLVLASDLSPSLPPSPSPLRPQSPHLHGHGRLRCHRAAEGGEQGRLVVELVGFGGAVRQVGQRRVQRMAVKAAKELHLGPPSRECRIMEAALGGAMDHVVDEVFFAGSISEAILRAQGNDLVLIVFVPGKNEESVSMELTTFRDPAVLDEVKKQSLILRLQEGSTDAAYFAANLAPPGYSISQGDAHPPGMASLLRRAWSSVRQASKEMIGKAQSEDMAVEEGGPEVMKLPGEMMFSIFARLDSADLAHVSAVCKAWHAIADDDALWEARLVADNRPLWPSVQFVGNLLRAGFCQRPASDVRTGHRSRSPGTTLPSPTPNALLPFRSIYSQRAMVPRAIIFDGGSGYAKYGWSDEVAPQDTLATFLEFGNIESPLYLRLKNLYSVIFDRMRVKASAQPFVLSTPTVHSDDSQIEKQARRQLRETTFGILFELGVPAIRAIDQAVLALFA